MKKKKNYEQPETAVTRVELESPICTGSVKMEAETPHGQGANIEAQDINSDFKSANTFGVEDSWNSNN